MPFLNRTEAGQELGQRLLPLARECPVVIGLPRGGVEVAAKIAEALDTQLDVCVVRKVGAPGFPELAMGAVAEGGFVALSGEIIGALSVPQAQLNTAIAARREEVEEGVRRYRKGADGISIADRTVILVDDGIATGATVDAALMALRAQRPRRLVLATPVAAADTLARLRSAFDEVVCLVSATDLVAVGAWYTTFEPIGDGRVMDLLEQARRRLDVSAQVPERELAVLSDGRWLPANLAVPRGAHGIVVFAHGSGSGRRSPRNRLVAQALQRAGLATLLFDLLTPEEAALDAVTGELRFSIPLLTQRLVGATDWVETSAFTRGLRVAYFGASTGAAAALAAAAATPRRIAAVVSRGGRPDLARDALAKVRAPTLLIVGSEDVEVLDLNSWAAAQMTPKPSLVVIPGASHLFEEPGALEQVAAHAGRFFVEHLRGEARAATS